MQNKEASGYVQTLMDILKETNDLLIEMTADVQKKFDAAVNHKILEIENCMKKEQALILRLRGLEQNRQKVQKQMGYENLTFREIIAKQSPEEREPLEQMFLQMQQHLKEYQKIAKNAKNAMELNLHRIDRTLEQLRGMQANVYQENGNVFSEKKSFTSHKA